MGIKYLNMCKNFEWSAEFAEEVYRPPAGQQCGEGAEALQ
jgi:hypothetical protein